MSTSPSYSFATLKDVDSLAQIGYESYGIFKEKLGEKHWAKMESFVSNPDSYRSLLKEAQGLICKVDSKIIGMVFLVRSGSENKHFSKEWAYIRMLGVLPKYSGQGIGRALMKKTIELAKANNEEHLALHTSEFMNTARLMYVSMGFKMVKQIPDNFGAKYWVYLLKL